MLLQRTLTLAVFLLLAGPAIASPGPTANGGLLAQACLGCHGPASQGQGSVPGIAGRPAPELVEQMFAFRSGERPGTIMGRIARGYIPQEIEAVAAYLAQSR